MKRMRLTGWGNEGVWVFAEDVRMVTANGNPGWSDVVVRGYPHPIAVLGTPDEVQAALEAGDVAAVPRDHLWKPALQPEGVGVEQCAHCPVQRGPAENGVTWRSSTFGTWLPGAPPPCEGVQGP